MLLNAFVELWDPDHTFPGPKGQVQVNQGFWHQLCGQKSIDYGEDAP